MPSLSRSQSCTCKLLELQRASFKLSMEANVHSSGKQNCSGWGGVRLPTYCPHQPPSEMLILQHSVWKPWDATIPAFISQMTSSSLREETGQNLASDPRFNGLPSFLSPNRRHSGGFPDGSDGKEPSYNAGHPGSIPRLGRSPRVGHGNPLQCSCLENPMDRAGWWATVHGVSQSQSDWGTNTHPPTHRRHSGWHPFTSF